jgi:DNA polymerase III epsilon subunit-like protein
VQYTLNFLQCIGLDAEFFSVYDGKRLSKQGNPSGKPRVGLLALVSQNDDGSCKTLLIKPRLIDNETIDINIKYTGVTWSDYHNGIPYDEAMDQVKSLLKDAIVVGHDIESDECALCLNLNEIAHRVMDTATCSSVNGLSSSEKGKIKSKLSKLASSLLRRSIQSSAVHDPVEDAFASLEIFLKYRETFEEAVTPCSSKTVTLLDESGRTIRSE